MAKRKVNISKLIRDYKLSTPEATQSEIFKALTAQGHQLSRALVTQALKSLERQANPGGSPKGKRKKRRTKKNTATMSRSTAKTNRIAAAAQTQVDRLVLAADFSRSVGGIENALEALNVLRRVASKL